jgi:hypothetical protein
MQQSTNAALSALDSTLLFLFFCFLVCVANLLPFFLCSEENRSGLQSFSRIYLKGVFSFWEKDFGCVVSCFPSQAHGLFLFA